MRIKLDGTAEGPVANWLADSRAPEEFYDTSSDPHEVDNLIDDPAHADQIERMRRALTMWQHHTGDMGDIPERQMIAQWWTDGTHPKTAAPTFLLTAPTLYQEPDTTRHLSLEAPAGAEGGRTFIPRSSGRSGEGPDTHPLKLRQERRGTGHFLELRSTTQGASIAWTTDEGDDAHWHLYTAPLRFDEAVVLRAKAIRYGFLESGESTFLIDVAE